MSVEVVAEDFIEDLRRLRPELEAFGVTALYVFGSRVKGTANEDSDLDLFVEYVQAGRFSLLDLVAVQRAISEALGIKADVLTRRGLHPVLRDEIEGHAVQVF